MEPSSASVNCSEMWTIWIIVLIFYNITGLKNIVSMDRSHIFGAFVEQSFLSGSDTNVPCAAFFWITEIHHGDTEMSPHAVVQVSCTRTQTPCCCSCSTPTWGPGAPREWGRRSAAICCRITATFHPRRTSEAKRKETDGETADFIWTI